MENPNKNLFSAMFAVQGELGGVVRDAINPHFRNQYATLEAVVTTIKPSLQKHGLIFIQWPGRFVNGVVTVSTMIVHAKTGESMDFHAEAPLEKQTPQGVGSAITYLCRYSLMAIFGLPPIDDDGSAANSDKNSDYGADELVAAIRRKKTLDELKTLGANNAFLRARDNLPIAEAKKVHDAYSDRRDFLEAKNAEENP